MEASYNRFGRVCRGWCEVGGVTGGRERAGGRRQLSPLAVGQAVSKVTSTALA